MTKYSYSTYNTTVFYPDPINSPAAQNTKFQYFSLNILKLLNISLKLRNKYICFSPIFPTLVNTLIYATRTLLVLSNYLLLQYTLLKFINYPRNYPLTPINPVQPSYPVKVVTYVDNHCCFAIYFLVRSTTPISTEVYVKVYNTRLV